MQLIIGAPMAEATLRYYACGTTEYDVSKMFSGHKPELRTFPAGVFLFSHESGNSVLFDTGYAPSMEGTGFKGAVYDRVLPPRVAKHETIDQRLKKDDIDPRTISHVVLSHLHPDHIGGVRFFPEANFIFSKAAHEALIKPRIRDIVIPKLLPEWFNDVPRLVLDNEHFTSTQVGPIRGYDLFGDGSYVLNELPGHARGHIGALVLSNVLLAADAAWGKDLLPWSDRLGFFQRLIIDDTKANQQTATRLQELKQDLTLYFSHDTYDKEVLIP